MKAFSMLALLVLTGCGSTATPGSGADGKSSASGSQKLPPSAWNATDACAMLDKSAMSAILGKPVADASLALVHESDGTGAATSECTYNLSDGSKASLMMRWSPIKDNDEGSINTTRNGLQQTAKAFGGSIETVESLGKAAYWVGLTSSLNVFIGEDRFIIVNTPSGPAAKTQAIAVAKKLGA